MKKYTVQTTEINIIIDAIDIDQAIDAAEDLIGDFTLTETSSFKCVGYTCDTMDSVKIEELRNDKEFNRY